MNWKIQYRKKGQNKILTEIVDLNFINRNDVKKWFLSVKTTKVQIMSDGYSGFLEGDRKDIEFINAKQIK